MVTPLSDARIFARRAERLGVGPVDLVVVPGAGHGLDIGAERLRVLKDRELAFLDACLAPGEAEGPEDAALQDGP